MHLQNLQIKFVRCFSAIICPWLECDDSHAPIITWIKVLEGKKWNTCFLTIYGTKWEWCNFTKTMYNKCKDDKEERITAHFNYKMAHEKIKASCEKIIKAFSITDDGTWETRCKENIKLVWHHGLRTVHKSANDCCSSVKYNINKQLKCCQGNKCHCFQNNVYYYWPWLLML